MASQEEVNRQREINDALERRASLERELVDILSRRVGIDSQSIIAQQDIGNTLVDQLKNLKGHNQEKRSIRNITTQLNNLSREAYSIGVETLGNEKERNKVLKQITDAESNIRTLTLQREEFRRKALNTTGEERRLYEAISDSLEEQVQESVDLNTQLKETVALSEKISNNFGVKTFGALSDITKKIPGLSRFSEPFQQAEEAAKKIAIRMQKINDERPKEDGSLRFSKSKINLASIQAGVKSLGPALTKALGPVALIAELFKGIMQADKETTELQKSMALTKVEAVEFRMALMNAAGASGDINITSSKLLETFSALNKQFGFITNFATDTLVTMTKLTGVVGVSSESAGNLAAASELTGTSFESNYKDVLATSYQLQRQSGVQMDLRDILEQTGKVTGTVRANLSANPSQIAKAITQAKLFGASLQDVANAGKSMLDFESSITAELEAELLLGRDINLERARAAALAGDQVTLAQELQKQAGDFSTFTKMNVIQQEALAKAMGMTSDQLADILFQQEVQGKSAKELRALGKDELAQRLEAQTLQDRFNASVEKLQNLFTDLAAGLTPVLYILGKALSIVGLIAATIQDLISFIGMGVGYEDPGSSATVGAFKSLFGMETADDAIIPAGYGETIIKKGKDTIALNNNDTVVAGTNLMGSSQNAPVQDNTETKRTNQLLERLLNQPAVFKIGTDEFYTATSKYSYQIQ
jgi:AraC-like DNA-binding protein